MPIDKNDVIDIISVREETNDVILTISDHLDWKDVESHILILEAKINCYLAFIESKEIYEKYPNAASRNILIRIMPKYKYPAKAVKYVSKLNKVIKSWDLSFTLTVIIEYPENEDHE